MFLVPAAIAANKAFTVTIHAACCSLFVYLCLCRSPRLQLEANCTWTSLTFVLLLFRFACKCKCESKATEAEPVACELQLTLLSRALSNSLAFSQPLPMSRAHTSTFYSREQSLNVCWQRGRLSDCVCSSCDKRWWLSLLYDIFYNIYS